MKAETGQKRVSTWALTVAAGILVVSACVGRGAGTLTPKGSTDSPIQIRSHHAHVVINNGFAQTEVTQTFYNPNPTDLEGIYSFPLPKTASLSEMTIWAGESELNGEVVTKEEADKIYEEEKQKGNDAGKAEKNSYQTFDFSIAKIPAQAETRCRFVYYQPIDIDTGVGRYLYPLEAGGTDDLAEAFWTQNKKVDGQFSVHVELKSAHPVVDVRVPSYAAVAQVQQSSEGDYTIDMTAQDAALDRDFVLYYRLVDDLPGRVEVIPYRADPNQPGTFMMVVTPGIDLQPLTNGADYIYVLDRSGSMSGGKIQTLAKGVSKAIGGMRPQDRFRVIAFNNSAHEITKGWVTATPEHIQRELEKVSQLSAGGGTDIHSSLRLALSSLDADRATSIVLVTDGATNSGIIAPEAFLKLLKQYDVRIFGFVMGNSANWPLMQMIGDVSGGFSVGVSNDDDIVGQIMLAKSKILHESMHDASIKIRGVKTFDTTDEYVGKIYRGQQLVLFGRYDKAGKATVTLDAKLTGEDKRYTCTFDFPEIDTDNPEIERLWALNQIEQHKDLCKAGAMPETELKEVEQNLGTKYQLVTDETSMIVLSDQAFAERGIERRNQKRVAVERAAQVQRAQQPVRNYTVSSGQQTFPSRAPSIGGGGAIDPFTALGALLAAGLGLGGLRKRRG
jgi:Ca-activated chloride channel homolog